jgi:hypothetical protein
MNIVYHDIVITNKENLDKILIVFLNYGIL